MYERSVTSRYTRCSVALHLSFMCDNGYENTVASLPCGNYSHSISNLLLGVHSHLLFGQFLHGLISSITGCAPTNFSVIASTEKFTQ